MKLLTILIIICLVFFNYSKADENEEILKNIYTIQVYSSLSKEESRSEASKYQRFGRLFIWPKKIKNKMWYRVCIGTFFDKNEASIVLEKIKEKDNNSPFIIKIVN